MGERRAERRAVLAGDRDRRGLVEPQAPGRELVQAQSRRDDAWDRDRGDREHAVAVDARRSHGRRAAADARPAVAVLIRART